jgi:hypothetical protein
MDVLMRRFHGWNGAANPVSSKKIRLLGGTLFDWIPVFTGMTAAV